MRRSISAFLLCVLVSACAGTSPMQTGSDILFSRDVLPVIQSSFAPLLTADSDLDLSSWEGVISGSAQGEIVIPFDADRSLLIERAEQAGGPSAVEMDLVHRWIEEGARSDAGVIPYGDAVHLLYVCNQGSAVISVIDMETNLVVRTVDLRDHGFSANASPHHVAVAPDGSYWYVSLIGENTVLTFNAKNELVERVEFEVPGLLSLDDTNERLYVGRSMSAVNPPQRVGAFGRDGEEIEEIDVFYPRPHALATAPDGQHVFSASLGVNQMATINAATHDVELSEFDGPHHSLVQFAVTPDGESMIAGGEMSGQLLFFDIRNPMSPRVVKSIDLGGAPWHPSYLPDGSRAFVPRKHADAVSVVDMASMSVTSIVSGRGLAQPHGSAVRPDGRYMYISNNNLSGHFEPRYESDGDPTGTVVVIDTQSLQIVKVLEVENYPTGIGTRTAW